MSRDYRVYCDDILEAVDKIKQYTSNTSPEFLSEDPKTFDAVVRNLEIVGEAIKKVPDEIRSKYPEIAWQKIAGLRDILIHEYFGIDLEIICDIIQNKLPELEIQIKKVLDAGSGPALENGDVVDQVDLLHISKSKKGALLIK